jgi:(p)ppGpp synthase/HD superfamily hydrolase
MTSEAMGSVMQAKVLTPRLADALACAIEVHGNDRRKGTGIPYLAHLLAVCALVLADGGDEDEAIAALLHDTLEDHPELVSRGLLKSRFGPRVLRLVVACSDTPPEYTGGPKPPWRERKLRYLEHLRFAPPDVLRVAAADKIDNARSIAADFRTLGNSLWTRFNAGREDQLWFYRSLVEIIRAARPLGRLLEQLEEVVGELEALVRATPELREL